MHFYSDYFFKRMNFLKNLRIPFNKSLSSEEMSDLFDDSKYRKFFKEITGPEIYSKHISSGLVCCAFCSSLAQSHCHKFCFKCKKKVYTSCSPLLPGTFDYDSSYLNNSGTEATPWLYKTPCTGFERLVDTNYFRNFSTFSSSITVANFEVLEGIFMGITRNKRPCHICASVNMDIYTNCNEKDVENIPCKKILQEIAKKYDALIDMVKYIE